MLAGGTSLVTLVIADLVLPGRRLAPFSVVLLGATVATMLAGASRFQSRLFAFNRRSDAPPGLRIAIEYDGRGHADDSAQFRRDADRWDDIREQGWDLVHILGHHLEDDGAAAVAKFRAWLRRAEVSI